MQKMEMTFEELLLLKDIALFVGHLRDTPHKKGENATIAVEPYIGNHRKFVTRKIDAATKQCGTHLQALRCELYFLNDPSPLSVWFALNCLFSPNKQIFEQRLKDTIVDATMLMHPESELYKVARAITTDRITINDLSSKGDKS